MTDRRSDEPFDADVRESYRAARPGDDAARARVREAVRGRAARATSFVPSWRMHPVLAVASLAACVALGVWAGARWRPDDSPTVVARPGDAARPEVTFALRAPGASRVSVVGDFNGWDPVASPLRREATSDVWTASLPIEDGLHTYAFVIDGQEWRADPAAPLAPASAYGANSSLLVVGEKDAL